MSWNCQSLYPKKSELQNFVLKYKVKIILISETWLLSNSNFFLSDFTCHRVDRFRGGVALFVHNSIPHSVVKTISLDHSEAIVVEFSNNNSQKIKIASIYCSPSANNIEANEFFHKLTSIPGSVIVSGDFNAKHKAWNNSKNCNRGSNLLRICNQKNFTIFSPDSPTLHPSRGDVSVVDFVISKLFANISPIEVINDLSSDHFPILFNIDFDFPFESEKKSFNLAKANWRAYRERLEIHTVTLSEKYQSFSNESDIDECIVELNSAIKDAAEQSIPRKGQYSHRYPFNQTVHNLTKERNRYRNLYSKTCDPLYKSLVSQLNRLIRFHTNEMCDNDFSAKVASLNVKDLSLYQFARNLKRRKSAVPPLKNDQGDLIYSSEDKSNLLAKSFESSHSLTLDWPSIHDNKVKKSIDKLKKNKIAIPDSELFTLNELHNVLKELKPRKAPGEDEILNIFLKNLPLNMRKILLKLFNACLVKSYFPKFWKIASIFPIPKSGKDQSTPSGYRPISLLSNLGKTYEKLLLLRLNKFIRNNDVIKNHQFGFRESHSTTHQLIRLSKFVSLGFNQNQSTGAVSLDIEKAFDTTWHDGLIHKLMLIGFPVFLIKIVFSYLRDRRAFVKLSGKKSFIFNILAGVPQGSLLAPLLFICFINDLPTPKDCEVGTYADDTVFFTKTSWKRAKTLKKRLEEGFSKIEKFYKSWKIKINKEKTDAIIFTQSHKMSEIKSKYQMKIDNCEIPWKENIGYLGVRFDSKLNYKNQVDLALRKANGMISTLFSIFKKDSSLSKNLKLLIYKLYIRPIFTYAAPLIVNAPATRLQRLQVMQNKCLRMALDLPRYTMIDDLHELSKVPKISLFLQKLTDSFYQRSQNIENKFVNSLGTYDIPRSFRIKHRLPLKNPFQYQ